MSIEIKKLDGIVTVTMAQPEKKNALSPSMWDALADHFEQFSVETDVRSIVLRGKGSAFCSGADLGQIGGKETAAGDLSILRRASRMILAIHHCDKPVIAGVQGPSVGVGWSIALACDMIVAAESARFIAPFTKLGLVPDGGAIWFLTRQLGLRQAKQITYLANPLKADEALSLGLVNQIVSDDVFETALASLAQDFAMRPTHALGLTKQLFRESMTPSLASYLETESLAVISAKQSEDFKEGIAAFVEKRTPKFMGQ